jgi:N-acylneuraminate cytidylyltransferase
MAVAAFIFARGGSKGLPGKNIRSLAGKPLIAWSIEQALSIKRIDRVIVSTDSYEIATVAKNYGAEVPFIRPAELSGDHAPELLAWRHALNFLNEHEGMLPEIMLSIPATAPLRLAIDLENCLDEFSKGDADIVITVTDAYRNPWFNMVKMNSDGLVNLVMEPTAAITRRQDAPVVFDMATVAYVASSDFIMKHTEIFSGKVRAVKIPSERAIDIDTLFDFELAEFLINQRKIEP